MTLTPAQVRALRWLLSRGGEGVIDRYGRILAEGQTRPSDGATILRLITTGHLCSPAVLRIAVTDKGRAAAAAG